mgnify:CR=1 FL=1
MAILVPKRIPHRKVRKGKNNGVATRCNTVAFGEYGLMSLDNERVNSHQIEAARQAITRYIKRGGKIWIRIFPHTPVTKKPLDVKMGGGKGEPQFYVAKLVQLCSRWQKSPKSKQKKHYASLLTNCQFAVNLLRKEKCNGSNIARHRFIRQA